MHSSGTSIRHIIILATIGLVLVGCRPESSEHVIPEDEHPASMAVEGYAIDTNVSDGDSDSLREYAGDDDILSEITETETVITGESRTYRVTLVRRPATRGRVQTVSVGRVGEEHVTYYRDNEVGISVHEDGEYRWSYTLTKHAFRSILQPEMIREWQLTGATFEEFDERTNTAVLTVGVFRPDTDIGARVRVTVGRDGVEDATIIEDDWDWAD